MREKTFETKEYSVTTIEKGGAKIALCILTLRLPSESSASDALQHLFPDFLLSGTEQLDREAFDDRLATMGSDISATMSGNCLTLTVKARASEWSKTLNLLVSLLESPGFRSSELKRLKRVHENQLQELAEDARMVAHQSLRNRLYGSKHRLHSKLPLAIKKDIDKLTVKDFKAVHKQLRDSFLTATTYGSKKDTQEFVKRVQSLAPLEAVHPQKEEANSKTTHTLECISIPSKQNIEFSIGGRLPITIHHPDYPAFLMGISVLGMWGGFTGRLMSTVREKEGLTYGIYARIEGLQFGETGYWRIMTFFSPTLAETGLRSTFREIKLLLEKGVTAAELKRFKAILKSRQLLSRDSAVGYTARLHEYKLRNIAPNEIEAFEEQVQKLTSDSVNEALRKYLVPDTVLVIGAGPTESVAKALRAVNNEIR